MGAVSASSQDRSSQFIDDFCLLGAENGDALVGFGPFRPVDEPDPDHPTFFIQDFYLSRRHSWWVPDRTELISLSELTELSSAGISEIRFTPPDYKSYMATFAEFKRDFQGGKLVKAVPVVFERTSSSDIQFLNLLSRLSDLPSTLHAVAFRMQNEFVIGASPEVLFHKAQESQLLFCEAVAGTTRSADSERLLSDSHLREEHRLVVNDIRDQLAPFGRTLVSTNSFQPYPGLMHLRAEIAVEIGSKLGPQQLIRLLHPTAALGVFPRQDLDSDYIRRLDPSNCRGVFGAPYGVVLPNGYWKFVVLIRTLMIRDSEILVGSGGGLLSSSDLEREWAELEAKRENVKRLFLV